VTCNSMTDRHFFHKYTERDKKTHALQANAVTERDSEREREREWKRVTESDGEKEGESQYDYMKIICMIPSTIIARKKMALR
jgi:hypothetical protein